MEILPPTTRYSTENPAGRRTLTLLFFAILLCWLPFVYAHLYCLGYACMDTWVMASPAAMARAPLAIITPFVGTFDGQNSAWGLHWPGGPLLTSIFTPFLPHGPATFVAISLFYWLLESLAAAALVRRLTASPWMALCAFVFMIEDRTCFGDTWLQRYENLGNLFAIMAIMAMHSNRNPRLQLAVMAAGFFMLPLIHPVFSGLGLAWVAYLGLRTLLLKQPWRQFCAGLAGYAAGWATFFGYYWSRPWLYAIFINHYRLNIEMTRAKTPPGLRTFVEHFLALDRPTYAGTIVYMFGFAGLAYLAYGLWKSGRLWREFLAREDMAIFAGLGLLATVVLVQQTSNIVYWTCPWPFAAIVTCYFIHRMMMDFPMRQRALAGVLLALLIVHGSFLPARTYMWYKTGFVNLRAIVRNFAATLPQQGQLFVPEVLWDTFADGHRQVYVNQLPYYAGDPTQKRYASYISSLMKSGDVLVLDKDQSHPTLIDPTQPGWKQIGKCKLVYRGPGGGHGFDMTAYQKE